MKKVDLSESASSSSLITRSLVELVIIVIGILLALAANDWWTGQLNRLEEREILEAIAVDVAATEMLIRTNVETLEEIRRNLRIASEGVTGPVSNMSDQQVAEVFYSVLWDLPTLSVQMSAYKEIQASGRLGLIDDTELRRALTRYDQKILEVSDRLADALQNQQTKMDPFAISNAQLSLFTQRALRSLEDTRPLITLGEIQDHRLLLGSAVLQNQIAAKFMLVSFLHQPTLELLVIVQEIAVATQARLEQLGA